MSPVQFLSPQHTTQTISLPIAHCQALVQHFAATSVPQTAMSAADLDETGAQVYEWQPGELLDTRVFFSPRPRPNFALIVLNQPLHEHLDVIRDLWDIGKFQHSFLSPPW